MPAFEHYDTIVIGAGIIGSCCGYKMAASRKKTLIIEQHKIGHNKGSSHGASRIIRHCHTSEIYLPLVVDAFKEWHLLETLTDKPLYLRNGLLWLGDKEGSTKRSNLLNKYSIEHTSLCGGEEIQKIFAHLNYNNKKNEDKWHAIFEPNAGTMFADLCLKTVQEQFLLAGGQIRDNEKVERFNYSDSTKPIEIFTKNGSYSANVLVIAAGAWLQNFLKTDLVVEAQLVGVNYWQIKAEGEIDYKSSPNLIITELDNDLFMIPCVDYADKVKFGIHLGQKYDTQTEDQEIRKAADWMHELPAKHIAKHLSGLNSDYPSVKNTCLYTMTTDQNFILDKYPLNKNILIAGGMSGTGFKFALTIGKIITKMAEGIEITEFDLSPFKLTRKINLQIIKSKL